MIKVNKKKDKKYYLFQMDTTALNVISIAILLLLFFTLDLTYPSFWDDLEVSYFNNRFKCKNEVFVSL